MLINKWTKYVCKMCCTLWIAKLAITHMNLKHKFSFIISLTLQVVQWLKEWDSFPAVPKNLAFVGVFIGCATHWASHWKNTGHKRKGSWSDQTTTSNTINKTDITRATKRKETFDLQTRFRSNKYIITLSLFSKEDYGNLSVTPDILILVELIGLFHCIWASRYVCVCVCLCVLCVQQTGVIWWNACWYCTMTVFRRTYPLPLCAHYARGCFIYVPEKEGGILASVHFIWRVYDGSEIHTDDNFLPKTLQTCYLKRLQ